MHLRMVVYIHGRETLNKNALFLTQEENIFFWEKKTWQRRRDIKLESLDQNAYTLI